MPGPSVLDELELILADIRDGRGGQPPDRGDGGGDGGGNNKRPSHGGPPARRYSTAVVFAMISILMFFMAMVAAFLVLRTTSSLWVKFHVPRILWANTAVLILSSVTLEAAKKRLTENNTPQFERLWWLTTALGFLFLAGQLVAWRILVGEGIYVGSTLASGFFYVFTAAHGAHLLGGLGALVYAAVRRPDPSRLSRAAIADVVSYYWHFMDGLWLFLLAMLYFGS
jgi:cytochrome c oxidase subunit 3